MSIAHLELAIGSLAVIVGLNLLFLPRMRTARPRLYQVLRALCPFRRQDWESRTNLGSTADQRSHAVAEARARLRNQAKYFSGRAGGFTLTELLVIMVLCLLLLALLIPSVTSPKSKRDRIQCSNNLKEVGIALRLFDGDGNSRPQVDPDSEPCDGHSLLKRQVPAQLFQAVSNYLAGPRLLVCPADARAPAPAFRILRNDNLSYFLGLDRTGFPGILAGDRNVTLNGIPVRPGLVTMRGLAGLGWGTNLHRGLGNLAFADGSVRSKPSAAWGDPPEVGTPTNRLAIP
jgi:prepilin-type processing-associated H-X9-DG protein